jgi:PAS domain S-box-containing protein
VDTIFLVRSDWTTTDQSWGSDDEELYLSPEVFLMNKLDGEIPKRMTGAIRENIEEVLRSGSNTVRQFRYKIDDVERDLEAQFILFKYNQILVVLRDVTTFKRTISALMESEERFQDLSKEFETVIDRIPALVFYKDMEGRFIKVNKYVADAHNLTKEEMEGASTFDLYPDEAQQYLEDDLEVIKSGKVKMMYEERWVTAQGERWLSTSKIPLLDKDGVPKGIIGIAIDITDRKRAEEALRESQERFRLFFEKAPIYAYMISKDGDILDVNGAALKALGYSKEELVGRPLMSIYSSRSQADVERVFEQWKENGHVNEEGLEIETKDGKYRSVILNAEAVKNDKGEVLYSISLQRDITEKLTAKQALQESEEKFRKVFEEAPIGMALLTMDMVPVMVNRKIVEMLGYTEKDIGALQATALIHPLDLEAIRANAWSVIKGEISRFETDVRFIKKDRDILWVTMSMTVVRSEDGSVKFGLVMIVDVSQRKKVEEDMRWRLMRFKLEERSLYIVKESMPNLCYEALNDLLDTGYHGLVVSRTPKAEMEKVIKGPFEHIWLRAREGQKLLSMDLNDIEKRIETMHKKSVVVIDRTDFLITKYGFKETLSFIHAIRDISYLTGLIAIICVDPAAMKEYELRMLEKEGKEVEPMPRGKVPEELQDILRFIQERNMSGERPSYKEVGKALGLSQPTVRGRIRGLMASGFMIEDKRGRSKVLSLTDKGRHVFSM